MWVSGGKETILRFPALSPNTHTLTQDGSLAVSERAELEWERDLTASGRGGKVN